MGAQVVGYTGPAARRCALAERMQDEHTVLSRPVSAQIAVRTAAHLTGTHPERQATRHAVVPVTRLR